MSFSLETVKELRERTGAGMMDCKKALEESGGDVEKALNYLRKRGLAIAAKKALRTASEGRVASAVSDDGRRFAIVEVGCETDFVARTDEFQDYLNKVATIVVSNAPKDIESLMSTHVDGATLSDLQTSLVAKIGENIYVKRFEVVSVGEGEKAAVYIHAGSKIGVVVLFKDPNSRLTDELTKEIAMHVAAMSPQFISREHVPEDYITKEKGIYLEQLSGEKKPPEILEKIINGKLSKHLSEVCLTEQIFVKDPEGKKTVKAVLQAADPDASVLRFIRFEVGEKL
jgi:elongation factor Ts